MSELRAILGDTTEKVLGGSAGLDFASAWAKVEEAGLAKVLVGEDSGGFGGGWEDALVVVRACGRHAVALPLPEAILASRLCAGAHLVLPDRALSLSAFTDGRVQNGRFSGEMRRVAFGANADRVAALCGGVLLIASRERAMVEERENLAGEGRDTLRFADAPVQAAPINHWDGDRLYRACAMLRAAQMAGALDAALALSVQYTRERLQFGKPLASFQAIQQQLAVLAEETAASGMTAASAFRAADLTADDGCEFEIGCAKLRANQAARISTAIAHQVHGAMGFTAEYRLQHLTRRLWAWSSEFGNERHWAERIGARVAARGPANFWLDLVG